MDLSGYGAAEAEMPQQPVITQFQPGPDIRPVIPVKAKPVQQQSVGKEHEKDQRDQNDCERFSVQLVVFIHTFSDVQQLRSFGWLLLTQARFKKSSVPRSGIEARQQKGLPRQFQRSGGFPDAEITAIP